MWKFIDPRTAKERAKPRNWSSYRLTRFWMNSISGKCSKLITPKQFAVFPFALMVKKQWAASNKRFRSHNTGNKHVTAKNRSVKANNKSKLRFSRDFKSGIVGFIQCLNTGKSKNCITHALKMICTFEGTLSLSILNV